MAKSKPAQARQILKNANSDLVESLRQCVLNVLRGVVSLTPKQHKQLARYKRRLRKLVDSKTKIKDRKVIIQKGANFLLPLLGALIPQIVGGIASLINALARASDLKTTPPTDKEPPLADRKRRGKSDACQCVLYMYLHLMLMGTTIHYFA